MFERSKRFDDLKSVARKLEVLIEVLAFGVVYAFIWKDFYRDLNSIPIYHRGRFVLVGLYIFLCILIIYNAAGTKFGNRKMFEVVLAQTISMGIVNFITYIQMCLMSAMVVPAYGILLLYAIEFVMILGFCFLYDRLYFLFQEPWNMIMIHGEGDAYIHVQEKMEKRRDKYYIAKTVSADEGYDRIVEMIPQYNAVVLSDVAGSLRNDILKFCYLKNIRIYVVPKISDIVVRGGKNIDLFDMPLLMVKTGGITREQRFVKRFFDILLTCIALIPCSIIMLITAILIKSEDGGSVFYRQKRLTRGLKEFDILKFRSMREDAEKEGAMRATEDDERVTRVGRVIRRTRIDELPQLFNILKGDMSIVGPRPERIENVEEYMESIPEFRFRTKVKAGLTGYAQVYGKYNTTPYDKLRLDLMYIENYSILLDFKLMFMTFQVLFKKESTEGFDSHK